MKSKQREGIMALMRKKAKDDEPRRGGMRLPLGTDDRSAVPKTAARGKAADTPRPSKGSEKVPDAHAGGGESPVPSPAGKGK